MASKQAARRRATTNDSGNDLQAIRLLSVFEAAAVLGLSPWSIRRLISTGALPSRRILDRILISQADLAAFIDRSLVR